MGPLASRPLPGQLACCLSRSPHSHRPPALPSSHCFGAEPGTQASCHSSQDPASSPGVSFPISSLCVLFSELQRGFSLKAMERHFLTGGGTFLWVCIGRNTDRGWVRTAELKGGRRPAETRVGRGKDRPHAPLCLPPFKQLHQ